MVRIKNRSKFAPINKEKGKKWRYTEGDVFVKKDVFFQGVKKCEFLPFLDYVFAKKVLLTRRKIDFFTLLQKDR